jgi:AcrR family transcriptional regulator
VAAPVRERLFEAALALVAEQGVDGLTMDRVAKAAGVSRATVYRHLPGGREQLISETVAWEVGRFLDRATAAADGATSLEARLEAFLVSSRHGVDEHEVLQRVLEHDREEVLPSLGEVLPIVVGVLRGWLVPQLAAERLQPGQTVDGAADYLARMLVSFLGSAGGWDLDDPDQRTRLVRQELLAGVVTPAPT